MKSIELLAAIGEVRNEYIQDILIPIQSIQNDTVSEKNRTYTKEAPRIQNFRSPLLIAVIIALMLFLIGCTAVILMSISDMSIAEEEYKEPAHYLENGELVAATQKVKTVLSLQGFEHSKNYMAMQEWYEFENSYDPTNELLYAADQAGFEAPREYDAYYVYTQEMINKVDEIALKYGLKLAGKELLTQHYDYAAFFDILGLSALVGKDTDVPVDYYSGSFYECGDFSIGFSYRIPEEMAEWDHEIYVSYAYTNKEFFRTLFITLWDSETIEEWNDTLRDGTEILIVKTGEKAWLFCDRDDAFISVGMDIAYRNGNGTQKIMTNQDIEAAAQMLDFSVKPKKPDMEAAEKKLKVSEQEYQAEQNRLQRQAASLPQESLFSYSSYSELIQHIMEDEEFFVSRFDERYQNFERECTYTLLDVNGDGEDELLIGRDGYVITIWSMVNGKTAYMSSSGENYICQDHVCESYIFKDGEPKHYYRKIETDLGQHEIAYIGYDTYNESWMYFDYTVDTESHPISENEAMDIINSFVRIPLDMKPVADYHYEK